ncbi:FUSC family protein [Clostridium hydrogeniformans]|uniref:FUSC family protein n=1 Tax=Clostridium hydrogeniformans TaxID=349933 RepID=UPI00048060A3|nr:aromatic acid exporter family protein [Clostridium hydrogeniformans]
MFKLERNQLRIVKTALAIVLSMLPFYVLNVDSPFYALIAALVTFQSTIYDSFMASKHRLLGTLIGAILGSILGSYFSFNIFAIFFGIIFLLNLVRYLNIPKAGTLSGISFLYVMSHSQVAPHEYYFIRLTETFIGIVIALAVNYIIFPPKPSHDVEKSSRALIDDIFTYLENHLNSKDPINTTDLYHSLKTYIDCLDIYSKELKPKRRDLLDINKLNLLKENFIEALSHISALENLAKDSYISSNNHKILSEKYFRTIKLKPYKDSTNNIVYNYHLEKLISLLDGFNKIISIPDYLKK